MLNNSTPAKSANLWLWVGLVAIASVALSLRLQCVLPFAALAAIGVLQMNRSQSLALVGLAWAINQGLGYTVLGYPHEAQGYAWGATIGLGSVAAVFAGETVRDALARQSLVVKSAAVLVAAYAVYEAVMFAAAVVLPASDVAFSATVVVQYALVNVVAFVTLVGVHYGLTLLGVFGSRANA